MFKLSRRLFVLALLVCLTALAVTLLSTHATIAQHISKGLPPSLFSAQFILDSRSAIGLTEDQAKTIQNLVSQLEQEKRSLDQEVAPESAKLLKLLDASKVDEQAALASLDKLLDLERRERRSEILNLIRIKNSIDEKQQTKLTEIRKQQSPRGIQAHPH